MADDRVDAGRVLVVDDDRSMAELLVHALRRRRFVARLANTPEDALAVARELDPHVAVVDLHLGDGPGGGHDLGVMLRAQSTRRLQVVVLTGDARFAADARTQSLGFAAHLVKPVVLRDLARLLELLVRLAGLPER